MQSLVGTSGEEDKTFVSIELATATLGILTAFDRAKKTEFVCFLAGVQLQCL